jgi:hypothetical protein
MFVLTPAQIQYLADRHDRLRRLARPAPSHSKSGSMIVTDIDSGQDLTCDVISCAHCDFTWQYLPHSGRTRGQCGLCHKYVCGRPFCNVLQCTSREQRLENLEKGRPLDWKPIVSTSGLILTG